MCLIERTAAERAVACFSGRLIEVTSRGAGVDFPVPEIASPEMARVASLVVVGYTLPSLPCVGFDM